MIHSVARRCVLGIMVCLTGVVDVSAQAGSPPASDSVSSRALSRAPSGALSRAAWGALSGVVRDDHGLALAGAVVSAVGTSTVFTTSDRDGRFTLHLPAGPYLLRAHLRGYLPAPGRIEPVSTRARAGIVITLERAATSGEPVVLVAGVGSADPVDAAPAGANADQAGTEREVEPREESEVAWRLRHARRSVLKDATEAPAAPVTLEDESLPEAAEAGASRALQNAARLATALFADAPLSGQVDLLTTTSFDRPQDLFSTINGAPRSVALLSLASGGADGAWKVRGMLTQGDLSSWILAGSYSRRHTAAHRVSAGLSFSMQRYLGGNVEAIEAIRDGSRNVASVYAYDDWRIGPRVSVGYGAKYAHYDYLPDPRLISPRARVTVQPIRNDPLTLQAVFSHRETAPGAEEFLPPDAGVWLPPERTFSPIGAGRFAPERLDHVEVAAEREWPGGIVVGVRAFRQQIDDQGAAVFDATVGGGSTPDHYHVASVGDFEVQGWSVSVSRGAADRVRASLDYSQFDARRRGPARDEAAILEVAESLLRTDERVRDLTATVESVLPVTATRVFVVYRVSTGFAAARFEDAPAARFDVQVRQALPFLSFASARWEMLVAMRNLFRSDTLDGSVYDELLVVKPPTRVLGGVTLRF